MRRLKLRKVLVQPVFSIEDEEGYLEDIEHPVVEIPAREWPTYSAERFPREVEAWQAQLDQDGDGAGASPPNGAAHRERARSEQRASAL